ncbi:MAG: DUF4126 family protein [Phycisphaeraceae bacterium]|nr:DUF4126 family protein [Phycisphaeraceae bacterium]
MVGVSSLVQVLGISGLFASRVFVPMFAAALIMRYGPEIGLIDDIGLLAGVTAEQPPTWFTHDITLTVLGILALAEILAHKSDAARELLTFVDHYGKPIAAALTLLGILSVSEAGFVESVVQQAGLGDYILPFLVAGATFVVARAHNVVLGSFIEMDDSDDSGLLGMLSWAEDIWSLFGIFFFILYPLVMVFLIGLVVGLILLLRWRAHVREEKSRIPCVSCGESIYRSAIQCPKCGEANPSVRRVNWLGVATEFPAPAPERQTLDLVSKKRCGRCATRLTQRRPDLSCSACGTRPFAERDFISRYDAHVSGKLGQTLVICGALSTIPIFGLIPGVICYRMTLVAPYRRYVPRTRALFLKLLVSIVFFFLILLQLIPGAGIFMVPLMALLSYSVHRRTFLKLALRQVEVESAMPPARASVPTPPAAPSPPPPPIQASPTDSSPP